MFSYAVSAGSVPLVAAERRCNSFCGHSIEVGGLNCLIPIDATLRNDLDVSLEAVSLEQVLNVTKRASSLRLVLMDACRENPLASQMKRTITVASRSVAHFARVEPGPGTHDDRLCGQGRRDGIRRQRCQLTITQADLMANKATQAGQWSPKSAGNHERFSTRTPIPMRNAFNALHLKHDLFQLIKQAKITGKIQMIPRFLDGRPNLKHYGEGRALEFGAVAIPQLLQASLERTWRLMVHLQRETGHSTLAYRVVE